MMSRQYHEVGKGCPGPVGYPNLHDGQLLRLTTFRPRTLQRAHRRWGAFRDRYGRQAPPRGRRALGLRRGRRQVGAETGISDSSLTDWPGNTGFRHTAWTSRGILNCGHGFWCTGRTHGVDLRNRWKLLFVRCWAELDSRADLGVRIRHLLASSQGLGQTFRQPARQEGQGEPYEAYGG